MSSPLDHDEPADDTRRAPADDVATTSSANVGARVDARVDAEVQATLNAAATSLLAVGCADPFGTDPQVRLLCLWAVEQLRSIGAHPDRALTPLPADVVHATLDNATAALAKLPSELLTDTAVNDSVQAALGHATLSHVDGDR